MKSVSIVLSLFAATSITAGFAQGTVVFMNDDRALVKQWATLTDETLLIVPKAGAFVQIAYAPVGVPYSGYSILQTMASFLDKNPGWSLGPTAEFVARGKFDGGIISLDTVAAGSECQYVLFGWPTRWQTFDEALVNPSLWGFAGPWTALTGGAGNPPVSLADSFTGMTLVGVLPEPSGLALVALGGVTMLLWRRHGAKPNQTE